MPATTRRIEKKGQRAPRSVDNYRMKGGISGAAYCGCDAVYQNKRWSRLQQVEPSSREQVRLSGLPPAGPEDRQRTVQVVQR